MHKFIMGGILCPGDLAVPVEKMSGRGLKSSNEEEPEHSLLVTKPGAIIPCESSGHFGLSKNSGWSQLSMHLLTSLSALPGLL